MTTTAVGAVSAPRRFPPQLLAGLALVAVAWPLAWSNLDPVHRYMFTPLWVGYILVVDGLVFRRTGTSLLTRSPGRFAWLFVASAPLWWLFEAFNVRLGNWRYVFSYEQSRVEYVALASLAFSTVIPAMFETASLYRSLPALSRERRWLALPLGRRGLLGVAAAGAAMLVLTLLFPRQAFPLVWLGLFFLTDPLNNLAGAGSLSAQVARGRWDTVWVLFLAGITCGFFWEMWNIGANPKWVYDVPYAGGLKVFEMPLLGYGGYLPFALEVYALYHALYRAVARRPADWLGFDEPFDAVGVTARGATATSDSPSRADGPGSVGRVDRPFRRSI